MSKEQRLIYFEIVPSSNNRRRFSESPPVPYEKRLEKTREIRKKAENEKREAEQVAEKIMDNLEKIGIKCRRCGNRNTREDLALPKKEGVIHVRCIDCNYRWDEIKE